VKVAKLDARMIAAAALPRGKAEEVFWDQSLPGYGLRLRLSADGKTVLRRWIVQYRHGGRSPRMTWDTAAVSAEKARAAAQKVLAKVVLGEDPAGDRADRRAKDRLSVRGIITEYIADKSSDWRRTTRREVQRYLAASTYFGPLFSLPIDKVNRRDIGSRLIVIKREHGPIVAAGARSSPGSSPGRCARGCASRTQ
jgi:hypothetical protein